MNVLGQPCWKPEYVKRSVRLVAAVEQSAGSFFLATHSPFRYIGNFNKPGVQVKEEEVFWSIFAEERGEVLAAIKGEPGTGKSHLVYWLKIRTDREIKAKGEGFSEVETVLVQRRSGSLKDALGQILEQLGSRFRDQLSDVRNAVERLSATTAKATLLANLALEIGNRWTAEHKRPPLPKTLSHLSQLLNSKGVGNWLMRDDGPIDRQVRLLIEPSSVKDRENRPEFTEADLTPPAKYRTTNDNSAQVIQLLADFEEEPDLVATALQALNRALPDAVGQLTGITGPVLQKVFDDVRRKLGPKKTLALFIEDISVAGLDRDVINALEPQPRDGLCRLVSVIGITSNAWGLLEVAQRERVSPVYEIGAQMSQKWAQDPDEVVRFAARYLNAVRLPNREVERLAVAREDNPDITISACEDCEIRSKCHAIFGVVKFGSGVEVGMFPFSPRAPQALLSGLRFSGDRSSGGRSQRGFLEQILRPALEESRVHLSKSEFPHPETFSVEPPTIPYWARFQDEYLGRGWDEASRGRIKLLAQYWVESRSADSLASSLTAFLEPLGFPPFSRKAPDAAPPPPVTTPTPTRSTSALDGEKAKAFKRSQQPIADWMAGKKLRSDDEYRDLVVKLIGNAISWSDQRDVSIEEFKSRVNTRGFIRFEDQESRPIQALLWFELLRSTETENLLLALLHFQYYGKGTWNYEDGEFHERFVYGWIRKYRRKIIEAAQGDRSVKRRDGVAAAVGVMAAAAMIRDRRDIDGPPEEIVQRVFERWDPVTRPQTLSKELSQVVDDLPLRHELLSKVIVREIGVGQGESAPKDFVNPLPILEGVEEFRASRRVRPLSEKFNEGALKSPFSEVYSARLYHDFDSRLKAEAAAVERRLDELQSELADFGISHRKIAVAFRQGIDAVIDLIEVLQRTNRVFPHREFDQLRASGELRHSVAKWESAIAAADEARNSVPHRATELDTATFVAALNAFSVVRDFLTGLTRHVLEREKRLTAAGDSSREELVKVLEKIEKLETAK